MLKRGQQIGQRRQRIELDVAANAEFLECRTDGANVLAAVNYNNVQSPIGIERPYDGCEFD